jgi:hypothetical protein
MLALQVIEASAEQSRKKAGVVEGVGGAIYPVNVVLLMVGLDL